MMRWNVPLGLVAMALSGDPQAAALDAGRNSFNGYQLETPVTSYSPLTQVGNFTTEFVREVTVYENPDEVLLLDAVPLKKVRYRFADGLLESVQLTYEGRENRDRLLNWVETHYGKLPGNERRIIAQVVWHGEKMMIMLNYNRTQNEGTLWFISPSLHGEINRTTGSIPD
jgi:hypothetical protein